MIRQSRSWWAAGALAAIAALGPATASAQEIVFDVGQALALGTACSSAAGDTQFLAFGNDIAVVFGRLGIQLPANGGNPAFSDLASCGVRIPMTVKPGFRIAQLIQRLSYSVGKSANTTAKITLGARMLGLPQMSTTVDLPFGAMRATADAKLAEPFLGTACQGGQSGLYTIDVAASGNRASRNEALLVRVNRLFDITVTTVPCL